MKLHQGQETICETGSGADEALYFQVDGNELRLKRYLGNGRYRVCGLLAVGGFGCVFGAMDRWNYDNKVVIKTPYYMGDYCRPYIARAQAVFEQQIKSLNKLYDWEKRHLIGLSNAGFDSVVNLNDYFTDRSLDLFRPFRNAAGVEYFVSDELKENAPFLVLKYIRGDMLKELLEKKKAGEEGCFGQVKTLRLAKQILVLMDYLHEPRKTKKGRPFYYLLCDLKADNIIVTDEEQITLIDFGGVKIYWMDQQEVDVPIFVTDGYAAPEVYSGVLELRDNPRIDSRFDIFTMGALMAHALTGRHPYQFLVTYNPPQHAFNLNQYPFIAKPIRELVHRATAPDKNDRYPTAAAMLKDVRRALEKLS